MFLWYTYHKLIPDPKGPQASRWRQRKFRRLARFPFPDDLLPGSLSLSHLRCGKPTCHCAQGQGHPVRQLTYMLAGRKRVQHIPREWVDEVRRRVRAGREFQQALRDVLAANAELLVLAKQQRRKKASRKAHQKANKKAAKSSNKPSNPSSRS